MIAASWFEEMEKILPIQSLNFQESFRLFRMEEHARGSWQEFEENYLVDLLRFLKRDQALSEVEYTPVGNETAIRGFDKILGKRHENAPFKQIRITSIQGDTELVYLFRTKTSGKMYFSTTPQILMQFRICNQRFIIQMDVRGIRIAIKLKYSRKGNLKELVIKFLTGAETWIIKLTDVDILVSTLKRSVQEGDAFLLPYLGAHIGEALQVREFLLSRSIKSARIIYTYSFHELGEGNVPEGLIVVIVNGPTIQQIEDLEEAYFDYTAGLKEKAIYDLGVTFWNE